MAIKATVKTTSTPVVTKVVQGAVSLATGISGLNIDYDTVVDNDLLTYESSSNTVVAKTLSGINGGEFNNGTF